MREYDYSLMVETILTDAIAHYADQSVEYPYEIAFADLWAAYPTMVDETHEALCFLLMEERAREVLR